MGGRIARDRVGRVRARAVKTAATGASIPQMLERNRVDCAECIRDELVQAVLPQAVAAAMAVVTAAVAALFDGVRTLGVLLEAQYAPSRSRATGPDTVEEKHNARQARCHFGTVKALRPRHNLGPSTVPLRVIIILNEYHDSLRGASTNPSTQWCTYLHMYS